MFVIGKGQPRDEQLPRASQVLRSLPSVNTFENDWGVRKPLGMYNVSVDALPRLFIDVINSFQALRKEPLTGSAKLDAAGHALQSAQKLLLYASFGHIEDCKNLARVFFPKTASSDRDPNFREFQTAIEPYRDRLGRIVNAMKHRQARIGLYHANNSMVRISGYSIQTIIEPNTLGSDTNVHKKLRQTDVAATSFSHELRWLFVVLYVVGDHLARFVETMAGQKVPKADLGTALNAGAEQALATGGRPTFFDVGQTIAQIPGFVFPQEIRGQIPSVRLSQDRQTLDVGFTESASGLLTFGQLPGGQITLTATYSGDGATTSFKVP